MGAVQTVTVRGAGGWTFRMDVPAGTLARERFDEQLAKGELVLVDDEGRTLAPADVLTDITAPVPAAGDGADDGLEALSAKDLRELAAERGVDIGGLKRKADIVAALRVAAAVADDDATDDDPTDLEDDDLDLDDLD